MRNRDLFLMNIERNLFSEEEIYEYVYIILYFF